MKEDAKSEKNVWKTLEEFYKGRKKIYDTQTVIFLVIYNKCKSNRRFFFSLCMKNMIIA